MAFWNRKKEPSVRLIHTWTVAFLDEDEACVGLFANRKEKNKAKWAIERRLVEIWLDHSCKEDVRNAIRNIAHSWRLHILDPARVAREGLCYVRQALAQADYPIHVTFCVGRIGGSLFEQTYSEKFMNW